MKLIVLTEPGFFIEEDKILTSLFEEGLDTLHLRKPDSEPVYCERLLSLIPDIYHNSYRPRRVFTPVSVWICACATR